jgi:hypothetical protein
MLGYDVSTIALDEYLTKELNQNLQKYLEKEMLKMSDFTYMPRFATWGVDFATTSGKKIVNKDYLIPTKIIYNDKTTVCYFKDGSKETVHCAEDEQFVKEVGVMSCIMKKLFDSRNEFKRLVDSGYVQPQPKK